MTERDFGFWCLVFFAFIGAAVTLEWVVTHLSDWALRRALERSKRK